MDDGTRTHDNRNHNPGLYQLSYTHRSNFLSHCVLACPAGFEPATLGLEGRCSIQLSYGQFRDVRHLYGRGEEIRTPDILLPKQARYRAALHPVRGSGL